MNFTVTYERKAARSLRKIDSVQRKRIEATVEALAEDPRPTGATMLQGAHGTYRVRSGNCRVLYVIDDGIHVVTITDIGHRSAIYKEV